MAKRKIIWSDEAKKSFGEILDFYIQRNGNKRYSQELSKQLKKIISYLQKSNYLGKQTNEENTRVLIKGNYLIFYEIQDASIEILLIWDSRRNPDKLK